MIYVSQSLKKNIRSGKKKIRSTKWLGGMCIVTVGLLRFLRWETVSSPQTLQKCLEMFNKCTIIIITWNMVVSRQRKVFLEVQKRGVQSNRDTRMRYSGPVSLLTSHHLRGTCLNLITNKMNLLNYIILMTFCSALTFS